MSSSQKIVVVYAMLLAACGPRLVGVGDDGADASDDDDDDSATSTETTGEPPSTSDTSTSADTSTTTADTDHVFIVELDFPADPEPCDPFAQDCPEGEKCVPYGSSGGGWDANKCVPVMGEQATGEPCHFGGIVEATDDCDATGFCWNVMDIDGEAIGTCHAFCMGAPDQPSCPEGSYCPIRSEGFIALCIPTCDPLAQDCDEGLGCYWADQQFLCVATTQDLPIGAPCGYINDCAPGYFCVDTSLLPDCMGAACCTSFCNLELGPAQCDALPGTACVSFFEQGAAPPDYELVGVCIVP